MPHPTPISKRNTLVPQSVEAELRAQVNNLTTTVRALCAKLDADVGVTDTNYASTLVNDGVATAPVIINTHI